MYDFIGKAWDYHLNLMEAADEKQREDSRARFEEYAKRREQSQYSQRDGSIIISLTPDYNAAEPYGWQVKLDNEEGCIPEGCRGTAKDPQEAWEAAKAWLTEYKSQNNPNKFFTDIWW